VKSICISNNSKYFISGSDDKSVKIWNIHGKLIKNIENAHEDKVLICCVSTDS
jgi:WD40 repeat protein